MEDNSLEFEWFEWVSLGMRGEVLMHDDLSFSNVVFDCVLCIKVFYGGLLLSCFNWQYRIDWRGGGRGG
jgi:hypothetical protein